MDAEKFDNLIDKRLKHIIDFSSELTEKQAGEFPQLLYLKYLSKSNILNIEYSRNISPKMLAGDSGRFSIERIEGGKRLLKFSKSFRGQWLDMQEFLKLSDNELSDAIDNFILHELFHIKQNLTTARHGDIRQAPAVLRTADYHADANAAISAFLMYSFGNDFKENEWPTFYSRSVKAILWQMYVFNFPDIRGDTILPSRIVRYVTWHYQFHRLRLYNPGANFRDVQLMFEPAISLRNIRGAQRVDRDWPKKESSNFESNSVQLWLTAPNDFGVACIFRHSATDYRHYEQLFLGIFDCNTEDSCHYFDDFFEKNEELIGFGQNGNGGGGGNDDSPPDGGGSNDPNNLNLQGSSLDGLPQVLVIGKTWPSYYPHRPIAEAVSMPLFFHEVGIGLASDDLFNSSDESSNNLDLGGFDLEEVES